MTKISTVTMGKTAREQIPPKDGNLPPLQQAGFFGRHQELQQIEQALVKEGTRRLTITGIGGQGKTYLAIEAGHRLYRAGQFQKICFVDYAAFSMVEAVDLAIETLAKVLDNHLVNVATATDALTKTPTLLILNNLEKSSTEQLQRLLDVAAQWSEVGACRVLLTSQIADFKHSAYPTDNPLIHKVLPLSGFGEKEALAYFQRLWELPPVPRIQDPQPADLLRLFKQVAFHPLSIGVLAVPLKMLCPTALEERLAGLLAQTPDDSLVALLTLVLEGLEVEIEFSGWLYWLARLFQRKTTKTLSLEANTLRLLPRLGVFQGGAFEPDLLEITAFNKKQWHLLRSTLETGGLIKLELLPTFKVPYVKFHPTLAATLQARFSVAEDHSFVLSDYQQRYAQLAASMAYEESKHTIQSHTLLRRDLSNLLYAVHSALDAGEVWAAQFAQNINPFLHAFGFHRDSTALLSRLQEKVDNIQTDTIPKG
ncbi:MAG: hypothetical protein DRR19_14265 [Candidatus Parabeggiatoa sp. nov. 1]|nr:MAG: hypothetical protein DRR19_14265 [Gammaproteobacteria bacterium]